MMPDYSIEVTIRILDHNKKLVATEGFSGLSTRRNIQKFKAVYIETCKGMVREHYPADYFNLQITVECKKVINCG